MMDKGSNGIQVLVDVLGNGFDLRAELVLNLEQVLLVIFGDKVDSKTKMTESTRPTNSMQICLSIPWEIEVDNDIDRQDIDTSSENICAYQTTGFTIFEIMIDSKY